MKATNYKKNTKKNGSGLDELIAAITLKNCEKTEMFELISYD
jgi:hypothetical protein